MMVLAVKSSYPGGVNDARNLGKPYPTGNYVPEIWFGLSPGGVKHARNPRQGLPRWEFYALNPVQASPQREYRA